MCKVEGVLFFNFISMKTLNRAMLIGNLAADPDVRETPSGKTVVNFAIATNRLLKPKEGEKNITDYHRIVAWHKLGQICGEYLKKGSAVFVEGQLRNRSYETKEGEKKYVTEIKADNINILTWKKTKTGQPEAGLKPMLSNDDAEEDD